MIWYVKKSLRSKTASKKFVIGKVKPIHPNHKNARRRYQYRTNKLRKEHYFVIKKQKSLIQRSIPKNVGSWSRAFREKCLFAELNGAFKLKFIDANHGYGIFGNWKGDGVPEGTCIIADGKLVSVEETKGKLEGNILKWKRTANMVLLEHRVINDNPPDKKDRIETVWIAKRTASPCREYYEKEPI